MATLGQVKAAAFRVYGSMDIYANILRVDGVASSARKVVLRLNVTFQIADKVMNDRAWMTSVTAT
jgi:hypothetical protein